MKSVEDIIIDLRDLQKEIKVVQNNVSDLRSNAEDARLEGLLALHHVDIFF
jgi:hypothetical protein